MSDRDGGKGSNSGGRSILFFYLRGKSTQEEPNNVDRFESQPENVFSHPRSGLFVQLPALDACFPLSMQRETHCSYSACVRACDG